MFDSGNKCWTKTSVVFPFRKFQEARITEKYGDTYEKINNNCVHKRIRFTTMDCFKLTWVVVTDFIPPSDSGRLTTLDS